MKKIKKVLIIALIYLIGIGCVLALCSNAEKVNNQNTQQIVENK